MASVFSCGSCDKQYAENLCGGCHGVFYCNVKCQSEDWCKRHMNECHSQTGLISVELKELFGMRQPGTLRSSKFSSTRVPSFQGDEFIAELLKRLAIENTQSNVDWITNWIATNVPNALAAQRRFDFLSGVLAKRVGGKASHVVPSTKDQKGFKAHLRKNRFVITISRTYPGTLTILHYSATAKIGYTKVNVVVVTKDASKESPYYLVTTGMDRKEYANLSIGDPRRDTRQPETVYASLDKMIAALAPHRFASKGRNVGLNEPDFDE